MRMSKWEVNLTYQVPKGLSFKKSGLHSPTLYGCQAGLRVQTLGNYRTKKLSCSQRKISVSVYCIGYGNLKSQ